MHYLFCLLILTSSVSGITISGTVKDAETDRPLENVNIIVNDSEILGFSTTTGGRNPELINIQKLKTGISFNNYLSIKQ